MYDELEMTYPSLCVDFILYNQEEYRKLIENISMSETLLEALFSSPRLDSSMARILLETLVRIICLLILLNVCLT